MNSVIKVFFTIIFFCIANVLLGQNTVSPYSIFGPGEIQSGGFGTNKGMGGAGIALESGNYLNNLNPASYAGMDSLRLILEFGLEGKAYSLASSRESVSGFDGNLAYLALGFKYTSWMAGSIGMVPFSSVGYTIERNSFIEGMDEQYTSVYKGSGGISQFYFANAVKILKHLSLGVNMSLLFGPLVQDEYIQSTVNVPDLKIQRQDNLMSSYFDFGLQYKLPTKKRDYFLGLTYAHEQNLNSRHSTVVYDNQGSILSLEVGNTDYLIVPEMMGIGIGVKAQKYSLALDYNFEAWSGVQYPIQYDEFSDSHKLVFGAELNPWGKSAYNSTFKKWTYRFGCAYQTSYLKFGNSTFADKNFTLGVGIPLYGALSRMDFSITGGVNGSNSNNLIEEKYLKFNIGFSINEIAFIKRKID